MYKAKLIITGLVFWILIITNLAMAQTQLTAESITIRDGLSSDYVTDVIQDKYGFMWFATDDGLNRYDGYQFTIFKNIPGDSTSLPTNSVGTLLEDSEGTLWIGTKQGLVRYNRQSDSFTTYKLSESNEEWANSTLQIFEDSRKKLWLTTSEGAVEFDRQLQRIIRYDIQKTDNSVIPYTFFSGIINENKAGELYNLSQSFGLLKFDYDASLFVQISLKNNFIANIKTANKMFWAMVFDEQHNLWLGSAIGLIKVDLTKKMGYDFTPFKKRVIINRFRDNAIKGLFIDRDQNIWVSSVRDGIYLFDSQKQSFEKLQPSVSNTSYGPFYEDRFGILWVCSGRGAIKYNFDRKPFEIYTFSSNNEEDNNRRVWRLSKSLRYPNKIWLATNQGLSVFDKAHNTISQIPSRLKGLEQFDTKSINSILETQSGKLWIGTRSGLYSYDLASAELNSYKEIKYDDSALIDDRIRRLAVDKNENLWVGTRDGLHLRKANENRFSIIPSHRNRKYNIDLKNALRRLRENTTSLSSIMKVQDYADLTKEFVVREETKTLIYSLGEGTDEMFDYGWLETESGDTLWSAADYKGSFYASGTFKNREKMGLLNLKPGRYKLRYISDDSHSMQSFNGTAPLDSIYWGIQLFALSNEEFQKVSGFLNKSLQKSYLVGEKINILYYDSENTMWVGTADGISKIDSTFHVKNYFNIPGDDNSLSNNNVNDITEDLQGNIWITTKNGLNRFDPQNETFFSVYEKDGLPTSNLSAIEVDNQGNLWVSSIKGISKIELNEKGNQQIIVNYDVKDGLQGYWFYSNSSFKDESGKLYFSGPSGFNAFYPGSSNKTPPFLAIQDVKISNKTINQMEDFNFPDLNSLKEITLTHDQNDLSFEFAAIHFSRPDKNRLLYKMDGVDDEWQVGDRRFASYTNLDPGDYVFNLRGSNGDGIWSKETKQIKIHIAAPWYNNGLAYSIYVLVFLGLLFSIRRFEIARQQKNAKISESQLRAEAAELQAKASDAERRVLQGENERKTKELEEARELQLSMLPKELPQLPNLDIAVYMQTATEVGGDYYDFHVGLDGTLTVVIGDATGHGMKAGTMVTATKSLFRSYAANPDILFSFKEFTRCIKEMNFGKTSMCLTMLKIKGNKMQMSTAAMPPSFIFRRSTRVVEEHLFEAMPLGTMKSFPYEIKETTLKSGDTILLMSDGLPELLNDKEEMYGYQKTRNGFEDVAEKSPEEIINFLKEEGRNWNNDQAPDDDVTFVVIKVK